MSVTLYAAIESSPGVYIAWLVIGITCAWLTIKALDSPSYGDAGDFILGGLGAVIGGFAFSYFSHGWISFLVALVTACALVGSARIAASRNV